MGDLADNIAVGGHKGSDSSYWWMSFSVGWGSLKVHRKSTESSVVHNFYCSAGVSVAGFSFILPFCKSPTQGTIG